MAITPMAITPMALCYHGESGRASIFTASGGGGARAPQELIIPSALQQDEELGPECCLSLQSLP